MLSVLNKAVAAFRKMMNDIFIKNANLPKNDVTLCVCGNKEFAKIISDKSGAGVLLSAPSPLLQNEVAAHADMAMCHLGGDRIIIDEFQTELSDLLTREGFDVIKDTSPKEKYPDDIKFNACVCGKYLFGKEKNLSAVLLNEAKKQILTVVDIPQGYAKCSVCVVSEKAIITDDKSIDEACRRIGVDTLFISKGDIYLSDTHYGFIGGCSGKLSQNTVAFTGALSTHREGDRIKAFLAKYNMVALELTGGRLIDIGGILPLKEKKKNEI